MNTIDEISMLKKELSIVEEVWEKKYFKNMLSELVHLRTLKNQRAATYLDNLANGKTE